ncbi:hypothetical protein V3N99_15655 [Dermatophilaceae bacterium Soc4.6]
MLTLAAVGVFAFQAHQLRSTDSAAAAQLDVEAVKRDGVGEVSEIRPL